jgi:phosphatidylserine/phosphatidylglycerophosphate/cardiolipin synthase-like enzyme
MYQCVYYHCLQTNYQIKSINYSLMEKVLKISKRITEVGLAIVMAACVCGGAEAKSIEKLILDEVSSQIEKNSSSKVNATGSIEVAFSPHEGAEALVIKTIDSAVKGGEIRMLSYSFTSATVTRALLSAVNRGVSVSLVADYKNNITEDKYGKSRAALSALVNAGVDVRVIKAYPIHHDKVIIVDRKTVEIGSFNYSDAAANKNSENVLVNWNNKELAAVYLEHFVRNYKMSEEYKLQY